MSSYERVPRSVVYGDDTDARRVVADAESTNGPPTLTDDGVATGSPSHLVVLVELPGPGQSLDYDLWLWSSTLQKWLPETAVGTVTVNAAEAVSRQVFEVHGATKAYVELSNFAGTFTDLGANVWIERVTPSPWSTS